MRDMKKYLILGTLLLLVSLGCVETEPAKIVPAQTPETQQVQETTPTTTAPPTKEIAYLEFTSFSTLKQWDGDANKDGIETIIYPHSADGGDVKTDGTVTFTLYQTKISTTTFEEYTVELQEWTIEITKDEGGFAGITRRLEFDEKTENLVAMEDFFMGELHAKLVTPDGKEFEATTNII